MNQVGNTALVWLAAALPVFILPTPVVARPIDVIEFIQPSQHGIRGKWRKADGELSVARKKGDTLLEIPLRIGRESEYVLDLTAMPTDGDGGLVVGLVVGGRQCWVLLTPTARSRSGLKQLEGTEAEIEAATGPHSAMMLKEWNQIRCIVKPGAVKVTVDQRDVVNWEGDVGRLNSDPRWKTRQPDSLFLGAWSTHYRFSSIRLTPFNELEGQAKLSEPAHTTDRDPDKPPAGAVDPAPPDVRIDRPEAKLGRYRLDVKGIDTRTFLEAQRLYGERSHPQLLEAFRAGRAKTMTSPQGDPPSFEVYVPNSYDPATPHGLYVFINSMPKGAPRDKKFLPVFDRHRLIYVGPNDVGNKQNVPYRHAMAIVAVREMQRRYALDADRIYVAGASGGGRVASQVMIAESHIFSGGHPYVGANPYRQMGAFPTMFRNLARSRVQHAQAARRYVFYTGAKDFNRDQVKAIYDMYVKDGFRHVTYHEAPSAKHGPPTAEWLEKGILALDAPLKEGAPKAYKAAQGFAARRQVGSALIAYRRAALYGGTADFVPDAQRQMTKLMSQYQQEVADIEEQIAQKEYSDAIKSVATLVRRWQETADADAARLTAAIREARQ